VWQRQEIQSLPRSPLAQNRADALLVDKRFDVLDRCTGAIYWGEKETPRGMLVWLRNLVYACLFIACLPWLIHRCWRTGRYRVGLSQKLRGVRPAECRPAWLSQAQAASGEPTGGSSANGSTPTERSQQSFTIWLHAVSVGEVQLLVPLLASLRARYPVARLAVSTTTDSGMRLARERTPADVQLFYFPFDFSWAIERTLATIQPDVLLLAELELWPNLIDLTHRAGVRLGVINGRLSERSYRSYRRFRWLSRGMFAKLDLVTAQSDSYAERFRECGVAESHIVVSGSVKFDNVVCDRAAPEVGELAELVGLTPTYPGRDYRVWVAGSTQPSEEIACCRAFLRAREEFPELRMIVVPRHPDRFDAVAHELQRVMRSAHAAAASRPLKLQRRTQLAQPLTSEQWDVLLVDTIGELRWWWGLAELALVGGSFGKRGGQNMLEPAAYGASVAFGPQTSNFRDSVDLLLANQAAVRLSGLEDIYNWLHAGLKDPQTAAARGQRAQALITGQQGALERTLQSIDGLVASALRPMN
jgi:3-deoxy-D-manno-octulosonic-acid transferase